MAICYLHNEHIHSKDIDSENVNDDGEQEHDDGQKILRGSCELWNRGGHSFEWRRMHILNYIVSVK